MKEIDLKNSHPINLKTFGFVTREKLGDKTVIYRCGRDFIYYALHFYFPEKYNPFNNSASELENKNKLGLKLPWWLMWSLLQFRKMPKLLESEGLVLNINGREIDSWFQLVLGFTIPSRPSYEEVVRAVEDAIEKGEVVGVDFSIKIGGLVDHILFVYGYDDEHLYLFDTNKIPHLEYEKITDDDRFIMKLSKEELKKRLGPFSRIWKVTKVPNSY